MTTAQPFFFGPVDHHLLACVHCDNLLIDRTMVAIRCTTVEVIIPSCRKRIPRHGRCNFHIVLLTFPPRHAYKHSFPDEPVSRRVSPFDVTIPIRALQK